MKKSIINKNKYYLLGIVFIILIWSVVSLVFDENQMIFPSIFKVAKETINILGKPYTYTCLLFTFVRLIIGFVVALILSIILGTISGLNTKFKYFLSPLVTIIKTIPTASLVFLFLVISGARYAPIHIVVLICFPIIYESVVGGFENSDSYINDVLTLEKGSLLKKIVKIKLPLAFPYINVGIASSIGLSFKIEIMAEVLTGSTTNGLGSSIAFIQRNDPTNMAGIFAYSLICVLISLVIDFLCEKSKRN